MARDCGEEGKHGGDPEEQGADDVQDEAKHRVVSARREIMQDHRGSEHEAGNDGQQPGGAEERLGCLPVRAVDDGQDQSRAEPDGGEIDEGGRDQRQGH